MILYSRHCLLSQLGQLKERSGKYPTYYLDHINMKRSVQTKHVWFSSHYIHDLSDLTARSLHSSTSAGSTVPQKEGSPKSLNILQANSESLGEYP